MRRTALQICNAPLWKVQFTPSAPHLAASFLLETRTIQLGRCSNLQRKHHGTHRRHVDCQVVRTSKSCFSSSTELNKENDANPLSHDKKYHRNYEHKGPIEASAKSSDGLKSSSPCEESCKNQAGSTLSATEKEAFESLFQKLVVQRTATATSTAAGTTDTHNNEVSSGLPPELRHMAESAARRIMVVKKKKQGRDHSTVEPSNRIGDIETRGTGQVEHDMKLEERVQEVKAAIEKAPTAQDAWAVLEERIFKPVQVLGLNEIATDTDPQQAGSTRNRTSKKARRQQSRKVSASLTPWNSEKRLLLGSLPHILPFTIHHLATRFPASDLSITVLPHLKSISRIAHLLALTPGLYAVLLRVTWRRTNDPQDAIALLREMEVEGMSLGHSVLEALVEIVEEAERFQAGEMGTIVQAITRMTGWDGGLRELRESWIPLVRMRITEAAIREYHLKEDAKSAAAAAPVMETETTSLAGSQ